MCYIIGFSILGVLVFSAIMHNKKINNAKKLFTRMERIYSHARKGEISKSQADEFFECSDKALALLSQRPQKNTPEALLKEKIGKMSDQMALILAARAPSVSVSLGDDINIQLKDGRIKARVLDILKNKLFKSGK